MTTFDWSSEENRCFGCGDNPIGLKLEFTRDDEWIVARTELDKLYQGFKNSAHGGIIATLLDEASAWAAIEETQRIAPSYELRCQFLRPVPLEEEITVRATVVKRKHGIVKTRAEVRNKAGDILARANVSCRELDQEIEGAEEELI